MQAARTTESAGLDYLDAVAAGWLDLAAHHGSAHRWEPALRAAHVAARTLAAQNRWLASPRLEAWLRQAAAALGPSPGVTVEAFDEPLPGNPATAGIEGRGEGRGGSGVASRGTTCLHVLTEALPAGGHSAMAWRWIRRDTLHARHEVALLDPHSEAPAALLQAISLRDGRLHRAPPRAGWWARAAWLRALARARADRVVLHVEAADVISGVAFGVPGGPPVMLVNHAAHLFGTGISTSDLVLNCRGSALECRWTAWHRGARAQATVPIPLDEPAEAAGTSKAERAADRVASRLRERARLGIPPQAVVALTAGAHFKYLPVADLDFVQTWVRLLQAAPQAWLVVAGFAPDARWRDASRRCGGRIVLPGLVCAGEMQALHAAADLYAEAFAFGTTTSLLEAGIQGLPAVLAPQPAGPPLATDGLAVDGLLTRASDEPAYIRRVLGLIGDAAGRERLGQALQARIRAHHTGAGWLTHLEAALSRLPARHTARPAPAPQPTPEGDHLAWTRISQAWTAGPGESLERSLHHALAIGLPPRLEPAWEQACRQFGDLRQGRSIPLRGLRLLLRIVLPVLARAWPAAARGGLRACTFACRADLGPRLRERLARVLGRAEAPRQAWGDYRVRRPGRTALEAGASPPSRSAS